MQTQEEGNAIQIMTVRDVAVYLRVKGVTIYKMIRENKIPVTKIMSGVKNPMYRFNKSRIDKWIREQGCLLTQRFVVNKNKEVLNENHKH